MIVKKCRDKIKNLAKKLNLVKGGSLNPRKHRVETIYDGYTCEETNFEKKKIDYITNFYKKGTYVIGFMFNKEDQSFNICYRSTKFNHKYLGWVTSNKDINSHLDKLEEILTGE